MHYFIRAKKLDFLFNRHLQFILYIQPMFDKRKFLRALELAQHFACTALTQVQSQAQAHARKLNIDCNWLKFVKPKIYKKS